MDLEKLREAVNLGKVSGRVFVATADGSGLPHIAAAREVGMVDGFLVTLSTWFCPGTMANLKTNPLVSLVVWDQDRDFGYQLLGKAVKMEGIAMMDGYAGDTEKMRPLPQEERRITIEVEKILHFSVAPHSDVEE